jgi:hypothetical protein
MASLCAKLWVWQIEKIEFQAPMPNGTGHGRGAGGWAPSCMPSDTVLNTVSGLGAGPVLYWVQYPDSPGWWPPGVGYSTPPGPWSTPTWPRGWAWAGYCAPCVIHGHAPPHGPLAHISKFKFGIPCHGIQGGWGSSHFCIVKRKGQQTWPPFSSSYLVFSTALPQNIDNYLPELQKITKIPYFHVFWRKKICACRSHTNQCIHRLDLKSLMFWYEFLVLQNQPLYVQINRPLCGKMWFSQGSLYLPTMRFHGHIR